jgi:selenide,water dikinase
MPATDRHLLLVGGGHSHLFVLRAFGGRQREPGVQLTLVSPTPLSTYTGMVPGVIAGQYPARAAQIDVARLTAHAGGTFHVARAVRVDATARVLVLSDGTERGYDMVSFDVGARPRPPAHASSEAPLVAVKPIERALEVIDATLAAPAAARIAVVGAGAGGIEIAFALAARLRHHPSTSLLLCDRTNRPLEARGPRTVRLVERALAAARIRFAGGVEVAAVDAGGLQLRGGGTLAAGLVIWSTGAVGPELFRESHLPVDADGFLAVGANLRCAAHPYLFAAGDCAALTPYPDLPKAGVYAVRQGPLLARNLRAALRGAQLLSFRPQRRFLSLLNTADGRAILSYGAFAYHGRAAWWLNDWIDRRFVATFDR